MGGGGTNQKGHGAAEGETEKESRAAALGCSRGDKKRRRGKGILDVDERGLGGSGGGGTARRREAGAQQGRRTSPGGRE